MMTSLAELRMIEEQRVVGERNARMAEEQGRRDAIARAERDARDAVEARILAERAQALAIENARVTAEREARMRVEATEAAERTRLAAHLETQRIENELVLRREAIRKTRPTWMIGVTICAVLGAAALAVFAVDRMNSASQADIAAQHAKDEAEAAKKAQAEDAATIASLKQGSEDLDKQMAVAMAELDKKQSAADLAQHKKDIADIAKKKAENDERIRQAAEKKIRDERAGGLHMGKDSENNALTHKDFH
ncbi:MAG TPA: hypothetical protein VGM90_20290 [Kofleriaceae bacterium]